MLRLNVKKYIMYMIQAWMKKTCYRTRTHSKNTRVLCHTPKTLHGVVPHLLLIHSFSTLLIKLFTITLIKCCPSIIKPVLVFDAPVNCLQHLNALQTIAYMNLCQCLFCLTTTIAKPVCNNLPPASS